MFGAALSNIEMTVKKQQKDDTLPPVALILVRDCLAFLSLNSTSLISSKQSSKLRSEIEGLLFNYISLIFND